MEFIVLKAKLKRRLPLIILTTVLLSGLGVGLILVQKKQIFKKEAAGICPVEGATCQWTYPGNATGISFDYQVKDTNTGAIVKSGNTTTNSITFTPIANHTYSCKVKPISNICGAGPETSATGTCVGTIVPTTTPAPPTSTPPIPTATSNPTPNPTSTPGPSLTPSPTNTPGPEPTSPLLPTATTIPPSPTPPPKEVTPIPTAQPTMTPVPTSMPAPTQLPTSIPATPTPLADNLPVSGIVQPTYIILLLGVGLIFFGARLLL